MSLLNAAYRYSTITGNGDDLESRLEKHNPAKNTRICSWRRLATIVLSAIAILGLIAIVHLTGLSSRDRASCISRQPRPWEERELCHKVQTRREWRSLSHAEKHAYLGAVNCLRTKPSKLGLNQSLYDDFPWVHSRVGNYSHHAAAFLAWHRYFIHNYEANLRNECGFTGALTFWDWTLDWEDMTRSPVWSTTDGFGGTGNPELRNSVLNGHCVDDGPFAGLEVLYLDEKQDSHCLSRGFENGTELYEHGTWFRPAAIEALANEKGYNEFNLGLEDGPHIAIPRSIRGDFLLLTAPFGMLTLKRRSLEMR